MKTEIPDAMKKDVPQTKWGKLLLATPVVMTVIATLLAGLASSEMTRAQYDRAFAAQLQSKAGDQWSYFQAKRLRGVMQRNTLDLLRSTTLVRPLDEAALKPMGDLTPQTIAALLLGTTARRAASHPGSPAKSRAGSGRECQAGTRNRAAGPRIDGNGVGCGFEKCPGSGAGF
ncbi:MAG: DUF4337 family protein [Verrucomicrobiota bacterium]